MSDYLLLAGVALCVISIIVVVVQLLQTQAPRAGAILLILGIVAIFSAAYTSDAALTPETVLGAWDRVTGTAVPDAAPVADAPADAPSADTPTTDQRASAPAN